MNVDLNKLRCREKSFRRVGKWLLDLRWPFILNSTLISSLGLCRFESFGEILVCAFSNVQLEVVFEYVACRED